MKHPDDNKTIDMMDAAIGKLGTAIDNLESAQKRGRKALPTAEPVTDAVDTSVLAQTNQSASDLAVIQAAITTEQVRFSQQIGARIGRRQMASLFQKLVTVTDLVELQAIKDSREYRGMSYQTPDGKLVTVTTWDDYCTKVEGRSREQIDEDLRNLRAFGEEFLNGMQTHGIGYRQLRELRQIPESERGELLEQTGGKELTEEVISDLLEKHKKQIADKDKQIQAAEKKKTEAEQSAEAARRVAAEKNTVIDHLSEKLERPYTPRPDSLAKTAEEERVLVELNEAFQDAHTAALRLATVVDDTFENHIEGSLLADHARTCIDHIVKLLAGLAATHDIDVMPTITATLEVPAWLTASVGAQAAGEVAQFKRTKKD